ncbi:putative membrane protein YteJ [Lederbergia ruris]|uniref:Membrane protein YteJ n=1 Tax=Lederbergia ruris TaxID=217495 RepID=A0ABQ4KIE3_9BACI|nr:RDD family protein [Lederbergia ruris]GIN57740.1 putative membrane protein YteJ [Lederbergia ruris]
MTENYEEYTINGNDELKIQPTKIMKQNPAYAGFWMRFWAYLLDLIMIFSINGILIKPIFRGLGFSLSDGGMFSAYSIVSGIVFYAYFIFMTKFFQQTIGKMVFGLKVVPLKGETLGWGTIIFREGIGRYISATITILYTVVAFTPKKQGLHDIFADTSVVHA